VLRHAQVRGDLDRAHHLLFCVPAYANGASSGDDGGHVHANASNDRSAGGDKGGYVDTDADAGATYGDAGSHEHANGKSRAYGDAFCPPGTQ
jgi:hypothetical protein